MGYMGVKVFVRKSTGLVRVGSLLDGITFNVGYQGAGPLFGLIFCVVYSYVALPGVEPISALSLAVLFGVFVWLAFSIIISNMPRSGGDYVVNSRLLHPVIGFTCTFMTIVVDIIAISMMTAMMINFAMGPPIAAAGWLLKNDALYNLGVLLQNPDIVFVIGIIFIGILTLINLSGIRNSFRVIAGSTIIAFISFFVGMAALAMRTEKDFISIYNSYMSPFTGTPDPYHEVIAEAATLGFTVQPYNIIHILAGAAMVLMYINIWSAHGTSFMAGEMKRADSFKRQIAMTGGGNLALMIPLIFMTFFINRVVGKEFLSAVTYAFYSGLSFPVYPYPTLFITMLLPPTIAVFFSFTCFLWAIPYCMGCFCTLTRRIFAWSFDRLLPEKLAEVSERFHTPIYSILLIFVLSIIIYPIVVYAGQLLAIYSVLCLLYLLGAVVVPSISCALFPFRKKEQYKGSPISKYDIGKVPFATIIGILSAGVALWVAYVFWAWRDVLMAGWTDLQIVLSQVIVVIVGLGLYYIIYSYRKRQGIDLSIVFKEIPPE